jgi:hypothetical protein
VGWEQWDARAGVLAHGFNLFEDIRYLTLSTLGGLVQGSYIYLPTHLLLVRGRLVDPSYYGRWSSESIISIAIQSPLPFDFEGYGEAAWHNSVGGSGDWAGLMGFKWAVENSDTRFHSSVEVRKYQSGFNAGYGWSGLGNQIYHGLDSQWRSINNWWNYLAFYTFTAETGRYFSGELELRLMGPIWFSGSAEWLEVTRGDESSPTWGLSIFPVCDGVSVLKLFQTGLLWKPHEYFRLFAGISNRVVANYGPLLEGFSPMFQERTHFLIQGAIQF